MANSETQAGTGLPGGVALFALLFLGSALVGLLVVANAPIAAIVVAGLLVVSVAQLRWENVRLAQLLVVSIFIDGISVGLISVGRLTALVAVFVLAARFATG